MMGALTALKFKGGKHDGETIMSAPRKVSRMVEFYKATRPDGTSFYDSTTKWEVGQTIEVPKVKNPSCCTGNVLHASDAPAETLIGGSWPCRLFKVEGESVAQEEHKHGFFKLTVVEELPADMALGPNGEEVAALIERAATLTADELDKLDAARFAARDAALALVTRDLISEEHFNTLCGRWAEVIEGKQAWAPPTQQPKVEDSVVEVGE